MPSSKIHIRGGRVIDPANGIDRNADVLVADGNVLLNGVPYDWEADDMVMGLDLGAADRGAIDTARDAAHFELYSRYALFYALVLSGLSVPLIDRLFPSARFQWHSERNQSPETLRDGVLINPTSG